MKRHRFLSMSLVICVALLLATPSLAQKSRFGRIAKEIDKALEEGSEAEARLLLQEMAAPRTAEAAHHVLITLRKFTHVDYLDTCVSVISHLGEEAIAKAYAKYRTRKDADSMVQAIVLLAAQHFEGEESESWLLKGLEDPTGIVVRNAVASLVVRRSKSAIPAMIEVLKKHKVKTTTIYVVRRGLISLTGQKFETAEEWSDFWELYGENFDPENPDIGDGEGETIVKRARPSDDFPRFFGVEVFSKNVTFIIDTSDSMRIYNQPDGSASTRGWEQHTRLARVQRELIRAIKQLPSAARFNIIAYNYKVKALNSGLLRASSGNKSKAVKFVTRLNAKSATYTDDALEEAMKDNTVDTLILLSDGSPNHGEDTGSDVLVPRILSDMRRMNRLKKVTIFTLGFDEPGTYPPDHKRAGKSSGSPHRMVEFLESLAGEHGGTYTSVK